MRLPDMEGRGVKAWKLKTDRNRKDWQPDWDATLANYLVHCTWSHPIWSYYNIVGIHLRDTPGVRPPYRHFPGAEYEVVIISLNPKMPAPTAEGIESGDEQIHALTPFDLCHQIKGINDQQFVHLVELIVKHIVSGEAAPDVDFAEFWRQSIDQTVEHLRKGCHYA